MNLRSNVGTLCDAVTTGFYTGRVERHTYYTLQSMCCCVCYSAKALQANSFQAVL